MKLEVGRVAMNKAVGIVERALPSKDYGDATSGILLDVKGKDFTLTANSVEVFISTQVTLNDECEAEGFAVPNGEILRNVVNNLRNQKKPITIEFNKEADELHLSCDKYKGTIAHYPSEGFVVIPTLEEITKHEKMSIPARLINDAVQRVAFARSKDTTHIQLTGIFIDQTENGINLVATDSLRFSGIQYSSKVNNPKSVVIGYKYLDLLRKLLDELEVDGSQILDLYVDDNRIYFVHSETKTVIGLQTFGNSFIEGYEGFLIPKDANEVLLKVNRERFLENLDLAVSHNKTIQDEIVFGLVEGKQVYFKSSENSSKLNEFNIPFEIDEAKGGTFEVQLVPQFLYDVMNVLKDKEITLGLVSKEEGPVTVYPVVEGNNISGDFVHVFSLT